MLTTLTDHIKNNLPEEAYSVWKSQKTTSLSSYNVQNILCDIKMIPVLSDMDHKEELIDILERLTIHKDVNATNCNIMVGKLEPYITVLPHMKKVCLSSQPVQHFNATNPYILSNPEIPDEYIINVRHVNYHCDERNQYHCNNPKESTVHTKNFLYFMDSKLETVKKVIPLKDMTEFVKFPSSVEDLEDLRLFVRDNSYLWCTATSRQILATTVPQIILGHINYPQKIISGGIRLLAHNQNLQDITQKNWLPFVDDNTGDIKCIFSFGPSCIIYNIDELTGRCSMAESYPTPFSFQQARGGSPPVPFQIPGTDVAYIATVHFAYDQPNIRRRYFHRFVFLNGNYKPLSITRSFTFFEPHGIEFVISCCKASPTSMYIGVGQNDVKAYIIEVSNETIQGLVRYNV